MFPISDLSLENCSGFFNTQPNYAFDWTGTTEELNIHFASKMTHRLASLHGG